MGGRRRRSMAIRQTSTPDLPRPMDFSHTTREIQDDRIRIVYHGQNPASSLTADWSAHPDFISLEPFLPAPPADVDLARIKFFSALYKTSTYSQFSAWFAGIPFSAGV
jgi:hypothetical protein